MLGPVLEKTTAYYSGTLTDESGAALPAASLATLALSYYDVASGTTINSRNAQNALNTNGVTVDSSGLLTWRLDPADTAILGTGRVEVHEALFTWTWGTNPTKTGRHLVQIAVQNLGIVT